ncbi:MAG: hypothetical protein V1790_03955 [Planctomycetota bacterium]
MERLIGRLTCSQVIAMVFALSWATCPMVFAVERGKQESKRVAREIVSRVVGVQQAESLLSQMHGMDLGTVLIPATAGSDAMTLVRPEGTYVFNNMARDVSGNLSGAVTVYDATGAVVAEVSISRITVLDDNRIDFDISATMSNATASASTSWAGVGSIVGINNGTKGLGMALVAPNGEDTKPMLMNYGALAASGTPASSLPFLTALVSSPVGGVASDESTDGESCEAAAVAGVMAWVALCVVAVIIIVVVVNCVVYCSPRICC